MASAVQAAAGTQGAVERSFCAKLREAAEIVAQIGVRVLFIVANLLMAAALFPISWHAVVLPIVAFGSATIAGFFYPSQSGWMGVRFPSPGSLLRPVDGRMPEHFTPHAPVGYTREDQNCAFNAVAHFLDSDPEVAQFLRNSVSDEIDLPGFHRFLDLYDPPADLRARFNEYVANHQGEPLLSCFNQFLEQQRPPAAPADRRIFFSIKDAFRSLAILHRPFSEFFRASDASAQAREAVSRGNSQNLRLALSRISTEIQANSGQQTDAGELMTLFLDPLPNRLKMHVLETFHINQTGLPPMPDPPTPKEERSGFLSLTLNPNESNPNLQGLLDNYCNHRGGFEISRRALQYPVERVTREFLQAPPVLRLQICRFENIEVVPETSWATDLSRWVMSFFRTPTPPPPPETRMVKNDIPIECPPQISVRLQNGEVRQYQLQSFVHHDGDFKNGHYTSAEIRDGQKYMEDDAFVTRVGNPVDQRRWEELLRHSYLLCYVPVQAPA